MIPQQRAGIAASSSAISSWRRIEALESRLRVPCRDGAEDHAVIRFSARLDDYPGPGRDNDMINLRRSRGLIESQRERGRVRLLIFGKASADGNLIVRTVRNFLSRNRQRPSGKTGTIDGASQSFAGRSWLPLCAEQIRRSQHSDGADYGLRIGHRVILPRMASSFVSMLVKRWSRSFCLDSRTETRVGRSENFIAAAAATVPRTRAATARA